ncbi:MAG: zinc-dependent metalloprotease [Deltaproteobacteria bacterium]|nr:zinc-dependent metalloprotease [Deltaproteobacteria bacterium]
MKMRNARWGLLGAALLLFAGGCAGEDDIDRTQPNRLPKSMFSGTWYVRSTVIDVPGTGTSSFIGMTGTMEKIRWEIQQDWLVAYRAYQEIPGTDQYKQDKATANNKAFTENPIAVFPITAHFDIKRQYNASTGEESNVIEENASDRPWHQRDYIRVDWTKSSLDPMTFSGVTGGREGVGYFVQQHENDPDAMRFLDKDSKPILFDQLETLATKKPTEWGNAVTYFDMVGRHLLEPEKVAYTFSDGSSQDIPLCYFTRYGGRNYQTTSCGPELSKIRTSFLRVGDRNFEPRPLPDREMAKFGFFRTERFTWDEKYGFTEDGRIYLANIHNIWENPYQANADGTLKRDGDGKLILTPIADRTPKPIVYHINKDYPCSLMASTKLIEKSWNEAFRRTVAVAKGLLKETQGDPAADLANISLEQVPNMFVLNTNGWVQKTPGDDWSCENLQRDESKVTALVGDLRYNFVYWIDQRQVTGPLGYGPSSADPETGEIIAGQAFVYGSAVDEYAGRALEIIRLLNGDLKIDDFTTGEHVKAYIAANQPNIDPAKIPADLASLKGKALFNKLMGPRRLSKLEMINKNGLNSLAAKAGHYTNPVDRIKGTWLEKALLDDEMVRGLAPYALPGSDARDPKNLSPTEKNLISPLAYLGGEVSKLDRIRIDRAAKKNMFLAEFADDSVQGLAEEVWKKHGASKDYDAMWQMLRELIYRGVMEHELGHTLGLRHNFAGSYDSMNFFNKYWELRSENLVERPAIGNGADLTTAQLYEQAKQTETQIKGKMREFQYSTIMDYGNGFNSDVHGIGKYDHAAILFGYAKQVELFKTADETAKVIFRQRFSDCTSKYESTPNLAYAPILENWHYSTIWNMLGKTDGLKTRTFASFDTVNTARENAQAACNQFVDSGQGDASQFNQQQDGGRPLEVPYMFCSDEYVGATVSCHRWDMGADPFEQADRMVRSYKDYYFFNNFKKGRFGHDSYSVYSRVAGRYFSYLPNIYQHWLFRVGFRSSTGAQDDTLRNYWSLGMYNGFNLLNEVIAKPQYGVYRSENTSDGPEYQLISYDPTAKIGGGVAVNKGEGRRRYSRFDFQSGYYYNDKILETGHFWEYLAAIEALTAATGTFVGVETQTDFSTFLVPYYIAFDAELIKTFEGVMTENYKAYAPRVVNGKFYTTPTITLGSGANQINPADGSPIDPAAATAPAANLDNWFTLKYYTLLQGLAGFSSTYSLTYADRQQVFRIGKGGLSVQPDPGPNHELYTCTDPVGGHTYGTIIPKGSAKDTGAARMITKCNEAMAGTSAFQQADTVEWLNFMQGLYDIFGNNVR